MPSARCISWALNFGLLALLAACSDSPTETGNLAFEAVVDGQAFVATNTDFSISNSGTTLLISGLRTSATGRRQISVQLDHWTGLGTYALTAPGSGALGFVVDHDTTDKLTGVWETTAASPGQVVIVSFDASAHTISGTFSFQARNSSGQSVSVTGGRFSGTYFVDP